MSKGGHSVNGCWGEKQSQIFGRHNMPSGRGTIWCRKCRLTFKTPGTCRCPKGEEQHEVISKKARAPSPKSKSRSKLASFLAHMHDSTCTCTRTSDGHPVKGVFPSKRQKHITSMVRYNKGVAADIKQRRLADEHLKTRSKRLKELQDKLTKEAQMRSAL